MATLDVKTIGFQFQTGAIRSQTIVYPMMNMKSFNSKLVRLEETEAQLLMHF